MSSKKSSKGGGHRCGFCRRSKEADNICGKLYTSGPLAAHVRCMQYSAQLIQYKHGFGLGGFKTHKVEAEIKRGKWLKCDICKRSKDKVRPTGATSGCAVAGCRKTFHYYCAAQTNDVITRRYVVRSDGRRHMEYRVFCTTAHRKIYEKHYKQDGKSMRSLASGSSTGLSSSDEDDASSSSDSDQKPSRKAKTTAPSSDRKRERRDPDRGDEKDAAPSPRDSAHQRSRRRESRKAPTPDVEKSAKSRGVSVTSSRRAAAHKTPDRSLKTPRSLDVKVVASRIPDDVCALFEGRNTRNAASGVSLEEEIRKEEARSRTVEQSYKNSKHSYNDAKGSDNDNYTNYGEIGTLEAVSSGAEADVFQADASSVASATQAANDFVLCFIEADEPVRGSLKSAVTSLALKSYPVEASRLWLWKHPQRSLSKFHVLLIVKEITAAICKRDFEKVRLLMLDVKEDDIERFNLLIELHQEYGEEVARNIYKKLRLSVHDNLRMAGEELGRDVGQYHRVKYTLGGGGDSADSGSGGGSGGGAGSEYLNFSLLVLSEVTDPQAVIRQALMRLNMLDVHQQHDLFRWNAASRLLDVEIFQTEVLQMKRLELQLLRAWLKKHVSAPPVVQLRPLEPCLLSDDLADSVTARLQAKFSRQGAAANGGGGGGARDVTDPDVLVFIGPVNVHVLRSRRYLQACLVENLEASLTSTNKVCCVFDVGADLGLANVVDILPVLPDDINVSLLSAFNPAHHLVSCVIFMASYSDAPPLALA